ncbi:MAG TPA: cupin domain-containing protein, partial [Mycobacteriales bacterium]|nr:cupin domain-containing protein [Mycobacteriales bacterium]
PRRPRTRDRPPPADLRRCDHIGGVSARQLVTGAKISGMSEAVRRVAADELTESDPTPGMRRQLAFTAPGLWSGLVHTDPGAASGWHHHGSHETSLYVVRGEMRIEFGPGGSDAVVGRAGDFLHVPANTVHRELNPGDAPSVAVIARAGDAGPPTVNVDGPDALDAS